MRARRRRYWLIILGILIVLGGTALLAVKYLPAQLHHWKVAGLVRDFSANPSQRTADPLVELLFYGDADEEEGRQIIALLLDPQVVTRITYANEEPMKISVKPRRRIKLGDLGANWESHLVIGGVTNAEGVLNSPSLDLDPAISDELVDMHFVYPGGGPVKIWNPGKYSGKIRLSYGIFPRLSSIMIRRMEEQIQTGTWWQKVCRFLGTGSSRVPKGVGRGYSCDFELPFELMVEQGGAPTTTLAK